MTRVAPRTLPLSSHCPLVRCSACRCEGEKRREGRREERREHEDWVSSKEGREALRQEVWKRGRGTEKYMHVCTSYLLISFIHFHF